MLRRTVLCLAALTAAALYTGCSGPANPPKPDEPGRPPESKKGEGAGADEHAHKAGAHGGRIWSIGADNYHVEPIFEKDGTVRLYLLGKDEARVQEADAQELKAYATPEGQSESVAFELRPAPQTGDAEGKASQLVGRLPEGLRGKRVVVVVPNIKIAGERFRFHFDNAAAPGHAGMPQGVAAGSEKERQLFLQPGGIYTEADIRANGGVVPSVKFQGVDEWPHDDAMEPGDKVCPVTDNKADARCNWVVNGQTYEFCCPPCLHKFVGWAKKEPQKIKVPGEYVHK